MQEHQVTVGGQRHHAARAVLRAGDAEPDRAGRDLSAARGAARPLHVQRLRRLSRARRKSWRSSSGRRPTSRCKITPTLHAERDRRRCTQIVRKVPVADHVIRYALQLARLTRAARGRRAGLRQRVRAVGRRAAGQPVPGAGRQGPGRAARAATTSRTRTSAPSPRRCCGIAS